MADRERDIRRRSRAAARYWAENVHGDRSAVIRTVGGFLPGDRGLRASHLEGRDAAGPRPCAAPPLALLPYVVAHTFRLARPGALPYPWVAAPGAAPPDPARPAHVCWYRLRLPPPPRRRRRYGSPTRARAAGDMWDVDRENEVPGDGISDAYVADDIGAVMIMAAGLSPLRAGTRSSHPLLRSDRHFGIYRPARIRSERMWRTLRDGGVLPDPATNVDMIVRACASYHRTERETMRSMLRLSLVITFTWEDVTDVIVRLGRFNTGRDGELSDREMRDAIREFALPARNIPFDVDADETLEDTAAFLRTADGESRAPRPRSAAELDRIRAAGAG